MLDLTSKILPNTVKVGGRFFLVNTDFRAWMKFEIEVSRIRKNVEQELDVSYLFPGEAPDYFDVNDLFVFSRPQSILPRQITYREVIVLDYELDADLIYAAFMEQYGIDLVEVDELHWHKFLALMKGLNGSTTLAKVMSYRGYEKTDSKKDPYEELRRAWEIPYLSEDEQEGLDEFSNLFK